MSKHDSHTGRTYSKEEAQKGCGNCFMQDCQWPGCMPKSAGQPTPVDGPVVLSDWNIRGHLAASLTCWHRLTGNEADELVALAKSWCGPPPPAGHAQSADELARDLKNAIDTATELRQQLRLMEEHHRSEVWRWQADGADNLATMGDRMGVLIYACDLRALLAEVASPGTYVNSANIIASDMPHTVVRKLVEAFHAATAATSTVAAAQPEQGGA